MSDEYSEDLTERLGAAERAIAHLEHHVEELNAVVTDQWKAIDKLVRENDRLRDRLEQMEHRPIGGTPEQERPPHY